MKFKETIFSALLTFSTLLISSGAHAEEGKVTSLLYNCNLSFSAHGNSIYIGLGYTHLEGKGRLSCYDLLTGASEHIDIKVNAVGPGVGLGVTGLNVSGAAVGIKISRGPESLLGRYVSVRANAAVGIGAAASIPIRFSKDDVSINVEAEGQSGLGAGIDLLAIDIEADGKRIVDTPPRKVEIRQLAETPLINDAQVIYVNENQPIVIIDRTGRPLKTIYLKSIPN